MQLFEICVKKTWQGAHAMAPVRCVFLFPKNVDTFRGIGGQTHRVLKYKKSLDRYIALSVKGSV